MAKRNASKKPAFGGYAISFQGRTDSLESLFGATPIGPAEMTKNPATGFLASTIGHNAVLAPDRGHAARVTSPPDA